MTLPKGRPGEPPEETALAQDIFLRFCRAVLNGTWDKASSIPLLSLLRGDAELQISLEAGDAWAPSAPLFVKTIDLIKPDVVMLVGAHACSFSQRVEIQPHVGERLAFALVEIRGGNRYLMAAHRADAEAEPSVAVSMMTFVDDWAVMTPIASWFDTSILSAPDMESLTPMAERIAATFEMRGMSPGMSLH